MIVETVAHARELIGSYRRDRETTGRGGGSPEMWRRWARERLASASRLEYYGRSGADVEREIAELYEAEAALREKVISDSP